MSGRIFSIISLCSFLMAVSAVILLAIPVPGFTLISGILTCMSAIGMLGLFLTQKKQKKDPDLSRPADTVIHDVEEKTSAVPGTTPAGDIGISPQAEGKSPETKTPPSVVPPELVECRVRFRKMQIAIGKLGEMLSLDEINPETAKEEADALIRNMTFITESIKKAFDIADNLSLSAKNAFSVSENVQTGVKAVTEALKDALDYATMLFEQSQAIHGIIGMLSDISSRINILSINASIVSARAGVHGRPFEVVAKEIRKLAEATDMSLARISEQISTIISTIGAVVEKINIANTQTSREREALLSVVGSLQGITLGVEVFRAVSKSAKEKSIDQSQGLGSLTENSLKFADSAARLATMEKDIRELLQTILAAEKTEEIEP